MERTRALDIIETLPKNRKQLLLHALQALTSGEEENILNLYEEISEEEEIFLTSEIEELDYKTPMAALKQALEENNHTNNHSTRKPTKREKKTKRDETYNKVINRPGDFSLLSKMDTYIRVSSVSMLNSNLLKKIRSDYPRIRMIFVSKSVYENCSADMLERFKRNNIDIIKH